MDIMKALAGRRITLARRRMAVMIAAFLAVAVSACSGVKEANGGSSGVKSSDAGDTGIKGTTAVSAAGASPATSGKAYLTFYGRASVKIKTAKGIVIYIDPYAPGDYNEKADIILVSHEHSDHNNVSLCTQNDGCRILRVADTINKDNSYNIFEISGVKIEPVPAANKNHPISSTNGFLITFDGICVYHASDTSKLDSMKDLKARNIDYALYPIDGYYNMSAAEAMECAVMAGARHNIPIHAMNADIKAFAPSGTIYVPEGGTIELSGK